MEVKNAEVERLVGQLTIANLLLRQENETLRAELERRMAEDAPDANP